MAKETLIVKNFGPIREAELDLRKVTVLIGKQASGKSVLAKLIHILGSLSPNIEDGELKRSFTHYKISEYLKENSELTYVGAKHKRYYKDQHLNKDIFDPELSNLYKEFNEARIEFEQLKESNDKGNMESRGVTLKSRLSARVFLNQKFFDLNTKIPKGYYFPAERILISMISKSLFSFNKADLEIPEYVTDFGVHFELVRDLVDEYLIPVLDVVYSFKEKDIIKLKTGEEIDLSSSSSGFQSVIPLAIILEAFIDNENCIFIVEEPELNLYPTTQKKFIEYLIEKCTKGSNRLIITTHSPYILTTINNCIEAKNAIKTNPEAIGAVNSLVPSAKQLDYKDVIAYYVADGTVKSIMNEEYQIIDANALDDVSNELGEVFDRLLDLKYQKQDQQ